MCEAGMPSAMADFFVFVVFPGDWFLITFEESVLEALAIF
jgi:hypothetical protein